MRSDLEVEKRENQQKAREIELLKSEVEQQKDQIRKLKEQLLESQQVNQSNDHKVQMLIKLLQSLELSET